MSDLLEPKESAYIPPHLDGSGWNRAENLALGDVIAMPGTFLEVHRIYFEGDEIVVQGRNRGQFRRYDPQDEVNIIHKAAGLLDPPAGLKTAYNEDAWQQSHREYKGEFPKAKEGEPDLTRHDREVKEYFYRGHEWEQAALAALSTGRLTAAQCRERNIHTQPPADEFKPLPQTLYHVTTGRTNVLKAGLMSRWELSMQSGLGLGGGDDRSISFTTSLETAKAILTAMLLGQEAAAGHFTLERMIEYAREGVGAAKPFLDDFEDQLKKEVQGYGQDDYKPGVRRSHGGMGKPPDDGEGWTPLTTGPRWMGGDGVTRYSRFERPMTLEELDRQRWMMFKKFLHCREQAGGTIDPLFFCTDTAALAKVDPSEIAILEYKAAPRAMGTFASGLEEIRVYSGKAVEFVGIVGDGVAKAAAGGKYGPVYHGSKEWCTSIKNDKYRVGLFFTSSPEAAKWFGPKVFKAYVTINKPFIVDCKQEHYSNISTPKQMRKWTHRDKVDADNIADWARQNGYDGVILKNIFEGSGVCVVADDYIVFDIPQVQRVAEAPVRFTNLFGARYPEVGEFVDKIAAKGVKAAPVTGLKREVPLPVVEYYMSGGCYDFAEALHRRFGLPLYGAFGPDGELLHAFVADPSNEKGYDIRGEFNLANAWENAAGGIRPCEAGIHNSEGGVGEALETVDSYFIGPAPKIAKPTVAPQAPESYSAVEFEGVVPGAGSNTGPGVASRAAKTAPAVSLAGVPTLTSLLGEVNISEIVDWEILEPLVGKLALKRGKDFDRLSEPEQDKLIQEAAMPELEARYNTVLAHYRGPSPFTVYRAVMVPRGASIDGVNASHSNWGRNNGFGIFWSWAESGMGTYNAEFMGDEVQFRGTVDRDSVNWDDTFVRGLMNDDEKEVKLHPGARVRLTGWRHKGEAEWQSPPAYLRVVTAGQKAKPGYIWARMPDDSPAARSVESHRARVEDTDLMGHGRDVGENHVTLRYGLLSEDIDEIREYLQTLEPFEVALGATIAFDPSESSDLAAPIVMPCSKGTLHEIHDRLADLGEWKEEEFEYTPHVTVAYVKPEAAEKYVGKRVRSPQTFTVSEVTVEWRVDGKKRTETVKLGTGAKTASAAKPTALYHGTSMSGIVGILQDNAMDEGCYWEREGEPHGPRLTRSKRVAFTFAHEGLGGDEGAVIEFNAQALARDYELVDYEDVDCAGDKWGKPEREVVVVTPRLTNVRKYITAIYLKKPFTSEESIREYAQLVEAEERMPARKWIAGYRKLLKDPLVRNAPKTAAAVPAMGITETPAFKAWFAGSEVVDKQGNPQVMYHATQSDIHEFRPYTHFGTQGAANDRHSALTRFYADVIKNPARSQGANIMPVYLSVKNPLRMPDLASLNDYGDTIADLDERYDEEDEEERDKRYPRGWEGEDSIATTLLGMGIIDIDEFEKHRSNQEAYKLLASKGYDGIVYKNVVEDPGNDSWIVFEPSQVKSAIGNSGAFNPAEKLVTSSANVTETPAFRSWFAGSKVVNPDGSPMVVYHGTNVDFEEFDPGKGEMGNHFGTTDQAEDFAPARRGQRGRTLACYLSIKRPLRLTDVGGFGVNEVVGQLVDQGVLSATFGEEILEDVQSGEMTEEAGQAMLRKAIIGKGYDGIVYLNRREGNGVPGQDDDDFDEFADEMGEGEFRAKYPGAQDSWIALSPNQIKSAIGNNGDFDPATNSITASWETFRGENPHLTKRQGILSRYGAELLSIPLAGAQVEWNNYGTEETRDALLREFSTEEGQRYLREVVQALPKTEGRVVAYRTGKIEDNKPQSYTLSEGMARTFSNEGTDITPAGLSFGKTHSEFGSIETCRVEIDPQGIRAYVPFDVEILADSRYVRSTAPVINHVAASGASEPWYAEADLTAPYADAPESKWVKQRWLAVNPSGPNFMHLFTLPTPLEKMKEQAPARKFTPSQIKVSQPLVLAKGVDYFLSHPEQLDDVSGPQPAIVARTKSGLWLLDGNHRATAAAVLGRGFTAKLLDLTHTHLASTKEGRDPFAGDGFPSFDEVINEIPRYDWKYNTVRTMRGLYQQIADIHDGPDPLTVYRAIALKDGPESVRTEGIGDCWAWNEKSAKAYYPDSSLDPVYIFEGRVRVEDVDWWETVKRGMCNYEEEIRVNKGAPVELIGWRELDNPEWHATKQTRVTASAPEQVDWRPILAELMTVLTPGIPEPGIEIVDMPNQRWLGLNTWTLGEDNTTIDIQKRATFDERTLRRVLAHELAHHEDSLVNCATKLRELEPKDYKTWRRREGDHGPLWRAIADRFNAKYGAGFVTAKSDESYDVHYEDVAPFFVLMFHFDNGKLQWQHAAKINPAMRRSLVLHYRENGTPHFGIFRLFKTTDSFFMDSPLIGKLPTAEANKPEEKERAERLFDDGEDLLGHLATTGKIASGRTTGGWLTNPDGTPLRTRVTAAQGAPHEYGSDKEGFLETIPDYVTYVNWCYMGRKDGEQSLINNLLNLPYSHPVDTDSSVQAQRKFKRCISPLRGLRFPLDVFRAERLPGGIDGLNTGKMGVCWSYSEHAAKPIMANGKGTDWLLHGRIESADAVDWGMTVSWALEKPREKEVRLRDGAQVQWIAYRELNDSSDWKKGKTRLVTASATRWYHGTSKENAEQILAAGEIRPGMDRNSGGPAPQPNAVYITSDPVIAEHYADGGVVLEVSVEPNAILLPDEDSLGELLESGELNGNDHYAGEVFDIYWDKLGIWDPSVTEDRHEKFMELANDRTKRPMFFNELKALARYLVKNNPERARQIIEESGKAAHIGPVKAIGEVPPPGLKRAAESRVEFKDEVTDIYSGQENHMLRLLRDGKVVAYLEYSEFEDKPHVQYIKTLPGETRKGYATALIKHLQAEYPGTEINLGMATSEGGKFIESLTFNAQETPDAARFRELEEKTAERDRLQAVADAYYAEGTHSAEEKEQFMEQMELMNPLHDRIWELEQELRGKSPTKRIVAADSAVNNRRESLGFRQDNPQVNGYEGAEEWLQGHPNVITGRYAMVSVPTAELIKLPGARNEHVAPDQNIIRSLVQSIKTKGFIPGNVLVCVEADGRASLFEGNHTVRAAYQAGLEVIPVSVRYFGGGEELPGVWDPANFDKAKKASRINQPAAPKMAEAMPRLGPFGPIFTEFLGKPLAAIGKLLKERKGEVPAVWDHPELGAIDLPWGKPGDPANEYAGGFGLSHILAKHGHGATGDKSIDPRTLATVIPTMSVFERDADKAQLSVAGYRATVRLRADGLEKRWLLTAYGTEPAGGTAGVPSSPEPKSRRDDHPSSGSVQPPTKDGSAKHDTTRRLAQSDNRESGMASLRGKTAADKQIVINVPGGRIEGGLVPGSQFAEEWCVEIPYPTVAYIDLVAVEPDKQRRGIGTRLVEQFLLKARAAGANACLLEPVRVDGPVRTDQLIEWYSKMGFTMLPIEDEDHDNTPLLMVKVLKAAKQAAAFPTKTFRKLWHVGRMDAQEKRMNSLEGDGLSVSLHPEEWKEIARLGGYPTWELTKAGNRFLDYHKLSDAQKREAIQWGVANGYATRGTVYRISWFDDEMDDTMSAEFDSREQAEREQMDENSEIEEIVGRPLATKKLEDRMMAKKSPATTLDYLVVCYAEDVLKLDGVWWQDTLDPDRYSAPRGVIFKSRLSGWTSRKVKEAASPSPLFHGTTATFDTFDTPAMFHTNRRYCEDLIAGQPDGRIIEATLDIGNPADLNALHLSPSDPNFREIAKKLEAEGYDGAQYRGEAWIAFKPEQIHVVAEKTAAARFPKFPTFKQLLTADASGRVLDTENNWDSLAEDVRDETEDFDSLPSEEQDRLIQGMARRKAEERYNYFKQVYRSWTFPLTVYRAVHLDKGIEGLYTENIGESWTWDEGSAENFIPGRSGIYILQAQVPEQSIDWQETLLLNMDSGLGDEENEVRLKFEAPLELVAYRTKTEGAEWTPLPKAVTAKRASGPYYHVTFTALVPKIRKQGIQVAKPSNWVQQSNKQRYGQGEVNAFNNRMDALRWACKMDWEFNTKSGSGKISIVEFDPALGAWEADTESDPLTQSGYQGQWLKSRMPVKPEQIESIYPLTPGLVREVVDRNKQASQQSPVSKEVLTRVRKILRELREEDGPGQCYTMSEILENEFGWRRAGGFYLKPGRGHNGHGDHSWNVLKDGTIVDGTHDQFGPPNVAVLKPGQPEYKRYHEYCGSYDCPVCTCPQCNETFAEEAEEARKAKQAMAMVNRNKTAKVENAENTGHADVTGLETIDLLQPVIDGVRFHYLPRQKNPGARSIIARPDRKSQRAGYALDLAYYWPQMIAGDRMEHKSAAQELGKQRALDALQALNGKLKAAKRHVTLLLVGGGAMMLAYDARQATSDLDVIPSPVSSDTIDLLERLRDEVTAEFRERNIQLPEDWINAQVRMTMVKGEDGTGQGYSLKDFAPIPGLSYSNLKLLAARPDKLLAMKTQAMRMREGNMDLPDIVTLVRMLGIHTLDQMYDVLEKFYDPYDWLALDEEHTEAERGTDDADEEIWLKGLIARAWPGKTTYEVDRKKLDAYEKAHTTKESI